MTSRGGGSRSRGRPIRAIRPRRHRPGLHRHLRGGLPHRRTAAAPLGSLGHPDGAPSANAPTGGAPATPSTSAPGGPRLAHGDRAHPGGRDRPTTVPGSPDHAGSSTATTATGLERPRRSRSGPPPARRDTGDGGAAAGRRWRAGAGAGRPGLLAVAAAPTDPRDPPTTPRLRAVAGSTRRRGGSGPGAWPAAGQPAPPTRCCWASSAAGPPSWCRCAGPLRRGRGRCVVFFRLGLVVIVVTGGAPGRLREPGSRPCALLASGGSPARVGRWSEHRRPVTPMRWSRRRCGGLRLAVVLICFGAANSLASPYRLLRCLPSVLYEAGVAVTVSLAFAPEVVRRSRRARRPTVCAAARPGA